MVLAYEFLPFAAYGIPAICIHTVSQSEPTIKTEDIVASFGEWQSYHYSDWAQSERVHQWDWWGRRVKLSLDVDLAVKVEVTDIASPRFLTKIKPSPFLLNETMEDLKYRNITIHAYAYSFKFTFAWSGEAHIKEELFEEWGLIPPGQPSKEDLAKNAAGMLISDFNKYCYAKADVLMSVDAPTLAGEPKFTLNPDFMGVLGMWLQDYRVEGYVAGTACEAMPQSTGTPVDLYLDKDLTTRCWAGVGTTKEYTELITPNVAFWFDHFAPKGAWWQTKLLNLGSELVFDGSKAYPNYLSWAYEVAGAKSAPAIAQWFRIDLGFRTYKDWTVPKIPEYEIPEEEKEKQKIIITIEPENKGTPKTSPSTETWWTKLAGLQWLFILVVVGTVAVAITYIVAEKKWGKR